MEIFTILFPSGTPLPARRQHTLQGPGSLSSVSLELYQAQRPIAQVGTLFNTDFYTHLKYVRGNLQSSGNDCNVIPDVADWVVRNLEDISFFYI